MNYSEIFPLLILHQLNPYIPRMLSLVDIGLGLSDPLYKDHFFSQTIRLPSYPVNFQRPLLHINEHQLQAFREKMAKQNAHEVPVEEEVAIKYTLFDLLERKKRICSKIIDRMVANQGPESLTENNTLCNEDLSNEADLHSNREKKTLASADLLEKNSSPLFDTKMPPRVTLERLFLRLNRQVFFEESSSRGFHKIVCKDQKHRVLMTFQGNHKERAYLVLLKTLEKLFQQSNSIFKDYVKEQESRVMGVVRRKRPVDYARGPISSKSVKGSLSKSPQKQICEEKDSLFEDDQEEERKKEKTEAKVEIFEKLQGIIEKIFGRISKSTPFVPKTRLKILKLAMSEGFFKEFSVLKVKNNLQFIERYQKLGVFLGMLAMIFQKCQSDFNEPLELTLTNLFDSKHGKKYHFFVNCLFTISDNTSTIL